MGYTHYWKNKGHKDDAANFLKVLAEAKAMYSRLPEHTDTAGGYYKDQPIKLCDGNGRGKPVFHTTEICFNGDESKGLAHETFIVTPEPLNFEFCKTARKPYDLMACAVLISMKKHLVNFKYSSDGDRADWEPAQKFYKSVIKKPKTVKTVTETVKTVIVDPEKYPLLKVKQ
jgi:hypothetical protein